MSLVGASGHVQVHVIVDGNGEPVIRIEDERLGELVDLPDVATAQEVRRLLGAAVRRALALIPLPEAECTRRREARLTALSDPRNVQFELVDDEENGAGLCAVDAYAFMIGGTVGVDAPGVDATRPQGGEA